MQVRQYTSKAFARMRAAQLSTGKKKFCVIDLAELKSEVDEVDIDDLYLYPYQYRVVTEEEAVKFHLGDQRMFRRRLPARD